MTCLIDLPNNFNLGLPHITIYALEEFIKFDSLLILRLISLSSFILLHTFMITLRCIICNIVSWSLLLIKSFSQVHRHEIINYFYCPGQLCLYFLIFPL